MAIIVEDGTKMDTVSPLPNSYVSIAEFRAYASQRGFTDFADSSPLTVADQQVEYALIRAADYIRQNYRLKWRGSLVRGFQPLDWPRRGVPVPDFFDPFYFEYQNVPLGFQDTLFIQENQIPREVKIGQMELALEVFAGGTMVSTAPLQDNLGRVTKREKLGPMEVEYFDQSGERQKTIYWSVHEMFRPFLDIGGTRFQGEVRRN